MSASSSSVVTGRARSCTGCRQVKLACDARRTAPQPCSRCKNKALQCKFDNSFRRIPMRRVAQDITNSLHKLLPTTTPAASASASSPARSSCAEEIHPAPSIVFSTSTDSSARLSAIQPSSHSHQSYRKWLSVSQNDYYIDYSLGNVQLDAETTVALLKHFERYYLPHAPFLANIQSLYTLAMKSPLLFWTIVLIATREHYRYEGLYEQICVAHGVLLSQITHVAIHNIEDIHALLLLCLWPIPKLREKHDPSWNYIGLAINAAMQINCHQPIPKGSIITAWKGMTDQTGASTEGETTGLTWIYCFSIGTRLASSQGLPPPLATASQLRSVVKAISTYSSALTNEQKAVVEILRLSSISTVEVDNTDDSQTRFSLIQMFDAQFDVIRQSHTSNWTIELDTDLLSSKLYLYALLLAITNDTTTDVQQRQANQDVILLRAQHAALRLVSRMTQLSNSPVEDGLYPAGTLSFYPKHYLTSLFTASLFLFRFLVSYQGVTQQEMETAVTGLTEAHKVFQSFPDHRDAIKAAINIQWLVDLIRNPEASHPVPLNELVVTNRLGASIVFDGTFRAAHHRNRNPVTGASPPVSNWLTISEDAGSRLPLAPEQKVVNPGTASNQQGTEDGQSQTQAQSLGLWTGWDNYMNDFEIGSEQWNSDLLSQMDPATQTQVFEAAAVSTLPILGLQQYPT